MSAEEWRQSMVPNYEVSSLGRVRRSAPGRKTYAGRVMKQQLQGGNYFTVRPTVNGRNVIFYVHDLVAAAFLGTRPADAIVNHKDTDKTNNVWLNLEYTTHAGNMAHAAENGCMAHGEGHPAHKLTDDRVRQLRADRAGGMSFSKLAAKHGVSIATAFNAANGKTWSHVA